MSPRASLIVPSLGRTSEVARLLESLCQQTCSNFHVVIVDQNKDDRLTTLISQYEEKLSITHVRSNSLGASRARNAGLPFCHGEIIFWPDDDSWYPQTTVEDVLNFFTSHPRAEGAIGILINELEQPHARWVPNSERHAHMMDAFTNAAEPVIFFRRQAVEKLGGFDELLGTGAQTPWGAGEGTDLTVRALKAKMQVIFSPELKVFHAQEVIQVQDNRQIQKANSYAKGMGAVIKKNYLPVTFVFIYLFTYFRALCWSCLRGRFVNMRYHWSRITGLIAGLIMN